jgi:hypothetical protein
MANITATMTAVIDQKRSQKLAIRLGKTPVTALFVTLKFCGWGQFDIVFNFFQLHSDFL